MNMQQLRENLYETILQMYEMKEKQENINEKLKKIVIERNQFKKALEEAVRKQNKFLN